MYEYEGMGVDLPKVRQIFSCSMFEQADSGGRLAGSNDIAHRISLTLRLSGHSGAGLLEKPNF